MEWTPIFSSDEMKKELKDCTIEKYALSEEKLLSYSI